ncbi:Gibberellin-regulated protein [Vigna angularis]|uniref:Gibberellin-regulated protein n=1 Tax=Phaseolus angularis TaxID=3914 RepID=A0A8T0L4R9_PHAAN|nr:gibberellin-regulated protein 12-like [Vigna angularis]KAG2406944.1 Gibberellin-regulated protein [Vigna angularis]
MTKFVSVLLLIFIMAFLTQFVYGGGEGSLKPRECASACNYRCSNTRIPTECLLYCNMCCKKCLCVPSGTSGNKQECPCYNNWKSRQGKPKCP